MKKSPRSAIPLPSKSALQALQAMAASREGLLVRQAGNGAMHWHVPGGDGRFWSLPTAKWLLTWGYAEDVSEQRFCNRIRISEEGRTVAKAGVHK